MGLKTKYGEIERGVYWGAGTIYDHSKRAEVEEFHYHLLDADGNAIGHGDGYFSEEHVIRALEAVLGTTETTIESGEPGRVRPEDAATGRVSASGRMHCPNCGGKLPEARSVGGKLRVGNGAYGGRCPTCGADLGETIELGAFSPFSMLLALVGAFATWLQGNFDSAVADSWLNAFGNNTSYANAEVWVKLHIGDPGGAGTNNAAGETTRQQASFGTSSGGAMTSDADTTWTNVSTSETLSHVSLWTASTAGTFLGNDQLSSNAPVTAGDTFRIPTGDLDCTITTVI